MAKQAAEKIAIERRSGSAGLQARVARSFEGWLQPLRYLGSKACKYAGLSNLKDPCLRA
jgi:hypothetical protein